MLVILKIPIVYLCAVVWWAIKAEPRPLEGAALAARPDHGPRSWAGRRSLGRRGFRPGPHGSPMRTYRRRTAFARARIRR